MKRNIISRGIACVLTGAMCASLFLTEPLSVRAEENEPAVTTEEQEEPVVVVVEPADTDPHYYRADPGLGQVPIAVATTTGDWKSRSPFDYRVPKDFAGGSFEWIDYPFADGKGDKVLQINYVHNGQSTFGGVSMQTSWNEGTVSVPDGSTIEFDVFYPKSGQGKYMRWRLQGTNNTQDSYMRDYVYNNLNPDWQGSYMGETWLKTHVSVSTNAGSTSSFSLELHGETGRPAETGTLLVANIQILAPDPEGTPLSMVQNDENQDSVVPLKSKYNEENGLFMVGAIGTGYVNGTRARHYEIFVDGNNLKADGTHPNGPSWLVGVDGTQIGNVNATGAFRSEYSIPTYAYQQIRDSGKDGEYKSHGHVMAWYNQAPSWMTRIAPEHLVQGYQGDVNFYGLGNGTDSSRLVKVDKDVAKRVQYNHIVNIMRHFLTTDEKYGSSEERGIILFNSWDILNEEVHESRHTETIAEDENSWRTALKQTNWLVAMSDDDIAGDLSEHYIYLLFKYAHIAAPNAAMAAAYKANYESLPEYMKLDGHDDNGSIDAYVLPDDQLPKLTYNDYGTATRSKARTVYNMVRDLNTAWLSDPLYDGRPLIEVVGFQGHDSVGSTLASDNQYAMALCAKLADEGLLSGISYSELDLKLLTDAPGGGATAPAALNVRQSDALGYEYALLYRLFTKFAPYVDHIMSWGVSGSGWQGSYVLFDGQGKANSGYYGAMDPDRFIAGHAYLDEYFAGEYASVLDGVAVDLGDLGMYTPGNGPAAPVQPTTPVIPGENEHPVTPEDPVTPPSNPINNGTSNIGFELIVVAPSASTEEKAEEPAKEEAEEAVDVETPETPKGETTEAAELEQKIAEAEKQVTSVKVKSAKNKQTLTWKATENAVKYVIYGAKAGEKFEQLAEVSADEALKFVNENTGKKVWKYKVAAFDENGAKLSTSMISFGASTDSKYALSTKITLSKKKMTIKVDKAKKLEVTTLLNDEAKRELKGEKIKAVRYESSNSMIATVDADGIITAVNPGTCYIYVVAASGVSAKCKITVK